MNRHFAVLRGKTARISAVLAAAASVPAVSFAQTVADPFDTALATVTT